MLWQDNLLALIILFACLAPTCLLDLQRQVLYHTFYCQLPPPKYSMWHFVNKQ